MLLQQKIAGEHHRSCKGRAETGARGHTQERRRRQEASHPGIYSTKEPSRTKT